MAEPVDITVAILLQEIRDAVHQMRSELSARIDQLFESVDQARSELSGRIDRINPRLDKLEESMLELATEQRVMLGEFRAFAERHGWALPSDVQR